MLRNPSPRINPYFPVSIHLSKPETEKLTEANTINGVSCHPLTDRHHHASSPPIVRASVNDGTLYMPIGIR